jgi:long-chain acyl-CoA synthetase
LAQDGNKLTGAVSEDVRTLVHAFKRRVAVAPNQTFLGARDETVEGRPYKWMTYKECDEFITNFAKGLKALDMMPDIEAEGRKWNFMGIYAKNRPEWALTDLACSSLNGTTIAFYDTLGPDSINYVISQTELTTITCAVQQLSKIILLKSQGKAQSIKNLISMDVFDKSVQRDGEDAGIKVYHINEVVEEGRKHPNMDLAQFMPTPEDIQMFCYTSGTTGDPKAAMLSHGNLVAAACGTLTVGGVDFNETDTIISYLPSAHSFEKVLFTATLICGMRIGYYGGDPLKLLDDLKVLRPTLFPSVPRLFNRIYDKIKAQVEEKSAVEKALFNRAVNGKLRHLQNGCHYNHKLWDRLIFNKIKELIGGKVRLMVTGSAPISAEVINFLKICFCSPIHEGYGQTESSAASCLTSGFDPEAGHVGGPLSCIRIRLKDIPEMNYMSTDEPNPRGEICYQGNSIFKGYFKNPEKTAEALTHDGWLSSGDVGMVRPNGSI